MFLTKTRFTLKVSTLILNKNFASQPDLLKLYGFPLSQPTRAVLLLLKSASIPYEFITVDALKAENRKPDFLKINPCTYFTFTVMYFSQLI